jgi:hypothetical protein
MWTLVLIWIWVAAPTPQSARTAMTSLSIPNFESKEACSVAYNSLKSDVTWGQDIDIVGLCVSSK